MNTYPSLDNMFSKRQDNYFLRDGEMSYTYDKQDFGKSCFFSSKYVNACDIQYFLGAIPTKRKF